MIRTCLKVMRRHIATKRLDLTPKQIAKDLKIDFYPIVGIRQRKLGACIFNQPSNQNLLTQQFLDQLSRYLLSYQYDSTVQNIFIQSKHNIFSHGIDYQRLAQSKQYLDKLTKIAITFAQFNKPIFGQIAGGAKGVAAYMLSMMTMPWGFQNCYLKCDQSNRGFIPLFGGTHRLARLPMRMGYYLAMTGDQLNAEEMAQLGFLKGRVLDGVQNAQIREKFHQANLYFRDKFRYMDFDDKDAMLEAAEKDKIAQNKQSYLKQLKQHQIQLLRQSPRNLNIKFAQNQTIASQTSYLNATNPVNSFAEEGSGRTINNYFQMRFQRPLNYLKKHHLVEDFDIRQAQIKRVNVVRIQQIFGMDTVEQIVEALKNEKEEWAQKAYKRITGADPLAVKLTFQLLKRAQNQPWIQCVQLEYAVARRLLQISELSLRTFPKSSHYILVSPHSKTPLDQISSELVNSFFEPAKDQYKFQHNVKPYSLLPVTDYFQELPDSVRKYLNCEEFVDKHNTEQKDQILRYLKTQKINFKSQVFNIDILRKKVYQKLELAKQKQRATERLQYLANHDRDLERYRNRREEFLDGVQEEDIRARVEQEVKNVFREKFENRFAALQAKTAPIYGLERKLQLFKKIKDIMLENLFKNGFDYQKKKAGKSDYTGPIYFDSKGRDIYSSVNPYIEQDEALRQLSVQVSNKTTLSEQFEPHQDKEMPKYYGTPDFMMHWEADRVAMWEKIKFRYDQRPQLWAEAYTYRELILQASRTSEELAGYLEWSYQNFYDLLNYTEKMKESYGEFAIDMVNEVKKAREEKITKLKQVSEQRKVVRGKGLFDKLYKWKQQRKMRQIFPFYFKQSVIPGEYRRSFLSTLDSTLKLFTAHSGARSKHDLLLKQQLGVFDRWINTQLANSYTDTLRYDVQYIASYLQILFVKEILMKRKEMEQEQGQLSVRELIETIRENFNVDFGYSNAGDSRDVDMQTIDRSLTQYLYFLVDMHTNAKRNIKAPQSKLLDFINRLKVKYQFDTDYAMPYSFEGLLLMIGKDRKKVYDRFLGNTYIAQPQFLQEYITRQINKDIPDFLATHSDLYAQQLDQAFQNHYDVHHSSLNSNKTRHLMTSYFYYMMEFEKKIHILCGKENFIPQKYVPEEEERTYIDYASKVINGVNNQEWYQQEIRAVVQELLKEREEVQKNMTKGELYIYDQQFAKKFQPENIRQMISNKLTEEVFVIKNIFTEQRDYDFKATTEQESDFDYTKTKRVIKNRDALKKLNNLTISEQIYLEYMNRKEEEEDEQKMLSQERKFVANERQYYKNGLTTRLPFKSYHRMTRDMFVYPEEMVSVPSTEREIDLFKKISINFEKSLSGQKIELSRFIPEYKELNRKMKDKVLQEMAEKISRVQSL